MRLLAALFQYRRNAPDRRMSKAVLRRSMHFTEYPRALPIRNCRTPHLLQLLDQFGGPLLQLIAHAGFHEIAEK